MGPLNQKADPVVTDLIAEAVTVAESLLEGAELPGVNVDRTLHASGSGASLLSVEESTAIMEWVCERLAKAWLKGYAAGVDFARSPAQVQAMRRKRAGKGARK